MNKINFKNAKKSLPKQYCPKVWYVFVQNYEGKKVQQTIGQYNQNLRRSGIS